MNLEDIGPIEHILKAFLAEALPDGGIDASKSLWQEPGTGSGAGSDLFPGRIDPRHLRFAVEAFYRASRSTGKNEYHTAADAHVRFMADSIREDHPTWAMGNALEMIGLFHWYNANYNPQGAALTEAAKRIVGYARKRKVTVTTADGVSFEHFPCGYTLGEAKDAGWTNDLSMFGSGLMWAYHLTNDESILQEAASFANYFVQPWKARDSGPQGYWQCGTWREGVGSWVIGPAHYSGFESTGAYADKASWVFSSVTCIDYLLRLYHYRPGPAYLDRCLQAARWAFDQCQFEDGSVGMCGRDDKWLGFTGDAITQVAMLKPLLKRKPEELQPLLDGAAKAWRYLNGRLPEARIADHGVEWIHRTTSIDPLVNVAMLWASAAVGWLNGRELFGR
ncbi:MAG: hypothetical protein IT210_09800 [Armatimonadetes bacterium]|nr:hypothetical protein [Armatimonadota bacterium]